jgi:dethiobiotin synthetase
MKQTGFFITGTDTGVGKTWATLCLMSVLQRRGLQVAAMKPVATGAVFNEDRWVNEDALALQRAASMALPYASVNPYLFEPPVSPHIAAELTGRPIDLAPIVRAFRELHERADWVLVEGVGGWKTPLSPREKVADLAEALGLPVILVVGLRLGCLNHALLTHEAIEASGVHFVGWIANHVARDFPHAAENIQTLDTALGFPPLAVLPYREEAREPSAEIASDAEVERILHVLAPSVTFRSF